MAAIKRECNLSSTIWLNIAHAPFLPLRALRQNLRA